MADKNKCRVIIKKASGEECTLPVDQCCDEADGGHVIVVRCDSVEECCCPKEE